MPINDDRSGSFASFRLSLPHVRSAPIATEERTSIYVGEGPLAEIALLVSRLRRRLVLAGCAQSRAEKRPPGWSPGCDIKRGCGRRLRFSLAFLQEALLRGAGEGLAVLIDYRKSPHLPVRIGVRI